MSGIAIPRSPGNSPARRKSLQSSAHAVGCLCLRILSVSPIVSTDLAAATVLAIAIEVVMEEGLVAALFAASCGIKVMTNSSRDVLVDSTIVFNVGSELVCK